MKKYMITLAAACLLCVGAAAPASAQFYPYGGPFGAALSFGFGNPGLYYGGYGYGYPYRYGPRYDYGYRPVTFGPRYVYEGCDLIRERRIVRHGRVIVRRYCVR